MVNMKVLGQASSLRPWMFCFSALLLTVSVSKADYNFTVRFHEFRNPLGLQCGECESGGSPACCDDVNQADTCIMVRPFTCDTRFRYLLRPFGALLETAPTGGFRIFTRSNGGNSDTFNEGPGGFLGLSNPFTITNTSTWTGRIQFFIDALDKAAQSGEAEAIINRFPINLELELGPTFTERINYTGIYNISEVEFDISFRVQCYENYFGPNCTTQCIPLQGIYTCGNDGQPVCVEDNRDPASNCTRCLPGYNPLLNCGRCLQGLDMATNCVDCLPGHDSSMNCTSCLPGYVLTGGTQCIRKDVETTMAVTDAQSQPGGAVTTDLGAVSGAVGAIAAIFVILLAVLVVVIVMMVLYLRRQKEENSTNLDTTEVQTDTGGRSAEEYNVENPLYGVMEQGIKSEEKQYLSENPYTELDHSSKQKPSEQSSFPYNTLEHSEDAPHKVDLAEKGGYDNTIDEPVQTQPLDEAATVNGTVAANGTTQESSDMLYTVLEEGPKPSPSALAGGIYDVPLQESDATEATTSELPPDVPAKHKYAETDVNTWQPHPPDSKQQSMATYTRHVKVQKLKSLQTAEYCGVSGITAHYSEL